MRIKIQRNNVGLELSARTVRKYIEDKYGCKIEINFKNGKRLVKIKGEVKNKQQIIDDANALLGVKSNPKAKRIIGCYGCRTIYSCEENGLIKYCFECGGCELNGENGFAIKEVVEYEGYCPACVNEQCGNSKNMDRG